MVHISIHIMGAIREPGPRPSKEPRGYVQGPEDPIQGAPLTTKYVSIEVHQFIYMRITRENTVFCEETTVNMYIAYTHMSSSKAYMDRYVNQN